MRWVAFIVTVTVVAQVSIDFRQRDERVLKSHCLVGVVGCVGLFRQHVKGIALVLFCTLLCLPSLACQDTTADLKHLESHRGFDQH